MKMRKLLAVVLAVTLAISAMALSAFATEYETITIPLTDATSTPSYSTTMTWTVPAYAIFGYLTNGDYLTITLPNNLAAYGLGVAYDIDYTLTINGVTVSLLGVSSSEGTAPEAIYLNAAGDGYVTASAVAADSTVAMYDSTGALVSLGYEYNVYTQQVDVGYFARNYGTYGNAQIPQSTLVSENTPVTITATISGVTSTAYLLDVSGYGDTDGWMPGAFDGWVSSNANVSVDVDGTTYTVRLANYDNSNYGSSMKIVYTPVDGSAESTVTAKDIVDFGSVTKAASSSSSADYVTIIGDTTGTDVTGEPLYWDHTLANRAIVATAANTEGATAQVVIDLSTYGTGSITGLAVYTLYANVDSTSYDDGNATALWFSTTASSLGFYNQVAGTYLLNGTTSELVFDVDVDLLYNTTYGIYNGTFYVHQLVTTGTTVYSGASYTNKNWWDTGAALRVAADGGAYLLINMPVEEEEVVDTTEPVEDTDTNTEDDEADDVTVDDTTPVETETNPTTGIVLALVPMAVAAAAAVASKRR